MISQHGCGFSVCCTQKGPDCKGEESAAGRSDEDHRDVCRGFATVTSKGDPEREPARQTRATKLPAFCFLPFNLVALPHISIVLRRYWQGDQSAPDPKVLWPWHLHDRSVGKGLWSQCSVVTCQMRRVVTWTALCMSSHEAHGCTVTASVGSPGQAHRLRGSGGLLHHLPLSLQRWVHRFQPRGHRSLAASGRACGQVQQTPGGLLARGGRCQIFCPHWTIFKARADMQDYMGMKRSDVFIRAKRWTRTTSTRFCQLWRRSARSTSKNMFFLDVIVLVGCCFLKGFRLFRTNTVCVPLWNKKNCS